MHFLIIFWNFVPVFGLTLACYGSSYVLFRRHRCRLIPVMGHFVHVAIGICMLCEQFFLGVDFW